MTDFKVGDRVRVTATGGTPAGAGRTATAGTVGFITSVTPSAWGRYTIDDTTWARPENLVLVSEDKSELETEKMIPASKVREIARLYAERHGWCAVVDAALEEMGATDDELVEVTFTRVRTVRMRRSDLDKLETDQDRLESHFIGNDPSSFFKGTRLPSGVTQTSNPWTRSEPVAVAPAKPASEGEWMDCDANTYFQSGHEVRFSPSTGRRTYGGHRVPDGVTMTTVRGGRSDFEGDIPVRFSQSIDGVFVRSVRASRLQRRSS